jgi:hypothetical protein
MTMQNSFKSAELFYCAIDSELTVFIPKIINIIFQSHSILDFVFITYENYWKLVAI